MKYPSAKKVKTPEPEIVTRKAKAVSASLAIEVYQEMIERLEDADDDAWLKHGKCHNPFASWTACSRTSEFSADV